MALDIGVDPIYVRIQWPSLNEQNCSPESDLDDEYNCAAWAAGDKTNWWEPSGLPEHYWPEGADLDYSISGYEAAFARVHFSRCTDGAFEIGVEKIALYALPDSTEFLHAARQLEDGRWTSKLGNRRDVDHDSPENLAGPWYGTPTIYMKRARDAT